MALASTEQGRAADANEHVDAVERLLSAYRTAAQPEWATEIERLRADCERKDREFATCERLLREAYDEIAKLRPPADEAEQLVVPAAGDEIVAG
jgi:ATP/maltotriose-dependent transcriptional regulator MalT